MIRRFRAQDAVPVSVLHADTIRRINSGDYSSEQIEPWAARSSPQLFVETMATHVRFVDIRGKAIVGFADYLPGNEQLTGLYVSADHQHSGVGRELYETIERDARRRRLSRLWLESTPIAVGFYEAMGFAKVRDDVRKVSSTELAVAIMEKRFD
jgi:putative acetyltransferase